MNVTATQHAGTIRFSLEHKRQDCFTMEAYDHNGEGWTLEIRITGNHYQVYNDDRLLRGSSLGAVMRGQVQKEVLRRGINATEKY